MRQWARRGVFALVSVAAGLTWMLVEDLDFLTWLMGDLGGWLWLLGLLCAVFFLLLNIRPVGAAYPTRRIRQILAETGCEKVNIIAHSKGGLDSRAAITRQGMAPYVASLTTVNTPHRGCIFAEYLLEKIPAAARQKIADTYNAALKRLGDERPDFLAAVTDLTASACEKRNAVTPDAPGVFYQSVMSYCRRAQHGKFPLNMTYPIVKHFDGLNDGLVAVDSARWGERFTLLEPKGKRGISHGDVVDLNRENIPGFDVREFYVSLAADLKRRGF